MKRKITVFTGSRAEYGLLYWLMKEIQMSELLTLQLLVSGMHLSPEFGDTWKLIVNDGFCIDEKVEMLLSSNTPAGVVKSMGLGTIGYADALDRLKPDMLVVLGDRFEALAVAQAALVMRIPLAHIHGGETTEGAYDDAIRHAITKMSHLHFVAAEPYRRRVIQMGEASNTVFNVGAIGLDHMTRSRRMSIHELASNLGFPLQAPFFLVTYHPVTIGDEDPGRTFGNLLEALDRFPRHQIVLTYPNADDGGRAIIPRLNAYAQTQPERVHAIPSLGFEHYLSALAEAAAVVGNSSSGIIEAPSLQVPSVNIGVRQFGRLSAESVIHCRTHPDEISNAISRALTAEFAKPSTRFTNPYGQGDAARSIVKVMESTRLPLQKHFFDAC